MKTLKNQVVVITGAGRGLGRAAAELLGAEGAIIVAASRTQSEIHELVDSIKKGGGDGLAVPTDVTSEQEVANLFSEVDKHYGQIDVLINSAGIGVFGSLENLTPQDFRRAIDVDLLGTIYPTLEAFKRMKTRKSGHILNVVSSSGTKGRAKETAYAAAKFGVNGFTLALLEEAKPFNIRVTAFKPGGINTPFWDNLRSHQPDPSVFMDPHEVARFIVDIVNGWDTLAVDDISINRSRR